MRRGDRGIWRAGAGLAELHVDDAAPLSLEAVGESGNGDGLKRIDLCSHSYGLATLRPKEKRGAPDGTPRLFGGL